jgi:protein TonB
MNARLLLPNRDSDVRWGYLDRLDTNPYLARAFAVSAALVLGVMLLLQAWPERIPTPQPSIDMPVDIWPVPAVRPVAPPRVRSTAPPRLAVAPRRPVPAPIEPAALDAPTGAAGSAAAPNADGSVDEPVASGAALMPAAWPDPDEFIPVEQPPMLVAMPTPAYPELARDAGIDGTVLVRVLVGADGFVHQAVVVQAVLGLDDAALAAAREAVFRPARQQERPVAVWALIPIEFRLRD